MKILHLTFLLFFLIRSLLSANSEDNSVLSLPDEITALNSQDHLLVDGIISPFSGQPCLCEVDLLAKGAQNVILKRIYLAPFLLNSYDSSKSKDQYFLYQFARGNYKGWSYFPHQHLGIRPQQNGESYLRFTTPTGITLDFVVTGGECRLNQKHFGMSNFALDEPSGKYDLRNIRIDVQGKEKVIVSLPDGTILQYKNDHRYSASLIPRHSYVLEKEILPNGKMLKYFYEHGQLARIESKDVNDRHTYASITVKHLPKSQQSFTKEFTSNTNQKAFYRFDYRKEKNKYGERGKIKSPLFLAEVKSPFHLNEQLHYSPRLLLDEISGRKEIFKCEYDVAYGSSKENSFLRVKSLLLPVSKTGSFTAAHIFNYEQPEPGKKEGSTTVVNSDGSRIKYLISKNLLVSSILYYDQNGVLKKEKVFQYDTNQKLVLYELKDGHITILSKQYAYDKFGNPIQEILKGNITALNSVDSYTINRKFSLDGLNLLIEEEFEDGPKYVYQYLPNTNLITAKFIQKNQKILKREFYDYDDCCNLICKILDDGDSIDKNDIQHVTERHILRYVLRQQQPFLHMCEWREEYYLDGKEEKPFKRIHYHYDDKGNVCQEDVHDYPEELNGKERLAYTIYKRFNDRGDWVSETNPCGQMKTYEYNGFGQCYSSTNFSRRKTIEKEYDKRARVFKEKIQGVDGLHHEISFEYDTQDRVIQKTDEFNNTHRYFYDCISKKISRTESPLSSNGIPVVTLSEYDAQGHEISKTDANGNCTKYSYNIYGKPTQVIYADKSIESFQYGKNGTLKQHVKADGEIVNYDHDILGRVTFIEYASSEKKPSETYVYNSFHLSKKIDRCGYVTGYSYDGLGRKSVEEFGGSRTEFKYDSLGRESAIIKYNEDNTLVTKWKKDFLNQVLEESKTDLQGNILFHISYDYDDDGNRKEVKRSIDHKPVSEFFTYDSFNRLTEHKDGCEYFTKYFYDENFINPLSQKVLKRTVVNPKNQKRIEVFDPYRHITSKEYLDPNNKRVGYEEFIFDPNGNLVEQKKHVHSNEMLQNVQIVNFAHNNRNRLENVTQKSGTELRTTNLLYTPGGRLFRKTLPDSTSISYTYDKLGYLQTVRSTNGTIDHYFEHDNLGHVLTAEDKKNHITIERDVNCFGNITKEQFSAGLTLEKKYDDFQRPLQIVISGRTINYTYDPLYLRNVTVKDANTKKTFTHKYESYDLDGNLLTEKLLNNLGSVDYLHDNNNQITLITSPYLTESYHYDSLGNRIEIKCNESTLKYSYDDLSQLTSENGNIYKYDSNENRIHKNGSDIQHNKFNEITFFDGFKFEYDKNGNLKTKQVNDSVFTLEYDSLNRLTGASSSNLQVEYLYDPFGRRIQKIVQQSNGKAVEEYLYDGDNEIAALENNKLKQFCVKDTSNKPVLIELEDKIYAPICDLQGNVRRLISAEINEVESKIEFTAYGEVLSNESSIFNPWSFASKRYDPELNLIYYGKRYYDPNLGRWLTTDPAGFVDGLNLYHYLHNNPYYYFDNDGRWAIAIPVIKIAWGAAAIAVITPSLPYLAGAGAMWVAAYYAHQAFNHLNDRHIMNQIQSQTEPQYETEIKEKEKKQKEHQGPNQEEKSKRHTPQQQALNDLVKESEKKGVSNSEADALLEWSEEYGLPSRDDRGKDHWIGGEHIHAGGKHIPVNK